MTPTLAPLPTVSASTPIMPSANGPAPLMTAEEFFARHGDERKELVRGVVEETEIPGFEHGAVVMVIALELGMYLRQHPTGRLAGNDTFVLLRRNPDLVRGADLAYISYERLPKEDRPRGFLNVMPELVCEVRSPSDTWTNVIGKVLEYLEAGVGIVLVFDPPSKSVSVYRPETRQDLFEMEDELTLPDLFPELRIPVRNFFQ
jgi:Uma2 family endonuclease